MNQMDTTSSTLTLPPASLSKLEPARRLIVLVPDLEADFMPAMRRIQILANAQQAHILLLSLCKNSRQEPSLRRRLITLSAMLQNGHLLADVEVEIGTNWVTTVEGLYQSGDTVVCFAEQRTGLLQQPLSQILQSNLKLPIYILSDLYPQRPKVNWLSQVIAWSGSVGVITGFFILQINILQISKDGLQSLLLVLSLIPEFWLIGALNNWF